jgi:hypothetical protein
MKLPQTGGCQCGKVRYEITAAPRAIYTCHCTACQHWSGSAFSIVVLVDDAAFRLSGAEPRPIRRIADSGRVVGRLVCPECGSWLCNATGDGGRRVRAGTLDDVSWVRPTTHFWIRSKQPWVILPEGGETFETEPDG